MSVELQCEALRDGGVLREVVDCRIFLGKQGSQTGPM